MTPPRLAPHLALAALLAAGCGGAAAPKPPPGPPFTSQGACDWGTSTNTCLAYAGATAATLSSLDSACAGTGGAVVAACPPASLVGTCTIPTPVYLSALHVYPPHDAAYGALICGNGAWRTGGAPAEAAAQATVSCEDPWDGTCADTSGPMTPTLKEAVERFCTGNDRTLLAAPCPAAGRSGTCTTLPGDLAWAIRHYQAATVAPDRQGCLAQGGTWIDG